MLFILYLQLVGVVVKTFGEAYPELVKHQDKIHSVIAEEEASFSRTLGKGIERFKKLAAAAQVGKFISLWASALPICDLQAWLPLALAAVVVPHLIRVWGVGGVGWCTNSCAC
jgi:hypothetical protein